MKLGTYSQVLFGVSWYLSTEIETLGEKKILSWDEENNHFFVQLNGL